jgi:trehalose 6-phosphate synthase
LRAVDEFLSRYPEWIGRFIFCQVAASTRAKLLACRDLQDESAAGEINARHGREDYALSRLSCGITGQTKYFELFRPADLCVLYSIHDGMNLVAKEFIEAALGLQIRARRPGHHGTR